MDYQPLKIKAINNPIMLCEDWLREGPQAMPKRAIINCFLSQDFNMKFLLWNYRRAVNQEFNRVVRDLISQYSLNMLILIETKLSSD